MANPTFSNVRRILTGSGVLIGLFVIALLMAGGCMTTSLESGQAGVRFSPFGGTDMTATYGEGINFHAPWVNVIGYDVRVQEKLEDMAALSNNGLNIGMDVSIRWRPIVSDLPKLHTTYGVDYYTKLVQPELRSAVREIVGQYTPEELYSTKRLELQTHILARVKQTVEAQFVRVEAILIRDVRLPEQIQTAIENKLKEEQEAQRYEFTLQKEKLEAERKRIEAEGEAEYQRIITQQLSPAYLRFKGIEATERLANSENAKTVIVGSGEDGLPLILGGQ